MAAGRGGWGSCHPRKHWTGVWSWFGLQLWESARGDGPGGKELTYPGKLRERPQELRGLNPLTGHGRTGGGDNPVVGIGNVSTKRGSQRIVGCFLFNPASEVVHVTGRVEVQVRALGAD